MWVVFEHQIYVYVNRENWIIKASFLATPCMPPNHEGNCREGGYVVTSSLVTVSDHKPVIKGTRSSHRDRYLELRNSRQRMLTFSWETSIGCVSRKCTQAVQGGFLGGHKSTPVKHKHMPFPPACSSPLITKDLPGSCWTGRYMRTNSH